MVLKMIDSGTGSSWSSGYVRRTLEAGGKLFEGGRTNYAGGIFQIMDKDIGIFLAQLRRFGLQAARIAGLAGGALDSIRGPVPPDRSRHAG
jgi:hypothetical protein